MSCCVFAVHQGHRWADCPRGQVIQVEDRCIRIGAVRLWESIDFPDIRRDGRHHRCDSWSGRFQPQDLPCMGPTLEDPNRHITDSMGLALLICTGTGIYYCKIIVKPHILSFDSSWTHESIISHHQQINDQYTLSVAKYHHSLFLWQCRAYKSPISYIIAQVCS